MFTFKGYHPRQIALFFGLFLLLFLQACDRKSSGENTSGSSPQTDRYSWFPKKLDEFRVDVDLSVYFSADDPLPAMTNKLTVTMKSPDKFRVESRDGQRKDVQVCDGKTVFTYDGVLNEYGVADADASELNSEMGQRRLVFMENARLLLESDWMESVSRRITTTTLKETVTLNGENVTHVVLSDKLMPLEFWCDQTPDARLKKVKLASETFSGVTIMEYSNWVTDSPLPPESFTFTPPEGAKKMEAVPKRAPAAPFTEPQGMDLVWSQPGYWNKLVVDPQSRGILAIPFVGDATIFNPDGQVVSNLGERDPLVDYALAISNVEQKKGIFISSVYGTNGKVIVCDLSGKNLWEGKNIARTQALAIASEVSDSTPTVVVSQSGVGIFHHGGVLALGKEGVLLWENTIENPVRKIYTEDLNADGIQEILVLSFGRSIDQFEKSGKTLNAIQFPDSVDFLGFLNRPGEKQRSVIGFDLKKGVLHGYDNDQAKDAWQIDLKETGFAHSAESAVTKPWLALSTSEGMVYVIDMEKKCVLKQFNAGHSLPSVAWLEAPGQTSPRLLLIVKKEIRCYSLKEGVQ